MVVVNERVKGIDKLPKRYRHLDWGDLIGLWSSGDLSADHRKRVARFLNRNNEEITRDSIKSVERYLRMDEEYNRARESTKTPTR
jgi:hypothetical protein